MSEKLKKRRRGPASPKQAAAGKRNLAAYLKSGTPAGGARHVTHGVISALAGNVPPIPGAEEVIAAADALVAQAVVDLGYSSEAEMPAMKLALLCSQRLALRVLGLASEYVRREGLLNKRGKPHALFTMIVSFQNTLRHNAIALGLERVAKKSKALTLESVAEEIAAQREKNSGEAHGNA